MSLICLCYFIAFLEIILSERENYETDRLPSSSFCFTPQMVEIAGAVPGQSQEPGHSSWSPIWVTRSKHLDHGQLISLTCEQGAGSEMEQPRLELVPI